MGVAPCLGSALQGNVNELPVGQIKASALSDPHLSGVPLVLPDSGGPLWSKEEILLHSLISEEFRLFCRMLVFPQQPGPVCYHSARFLFFPFVTRTDAGFIHYYLSVCVSKISVEPRLLFVSGIFRLLTVFTVFY